MGPLDLFIVFEKRNCKHLSFMRAQFDLHGKWMKWMKSNFIATNNNITFHGEIDFPQGNSIRTSIM